MGDGQEHMFVAAYVMALMYAHQNPNMLCTPKSYSTLVCAV